jgi:HlyD family secretion protein
MPLAKVRRRNEVLVAPLLPWRTPTKPRSGIGSSMRRRLPLLKPLSLLGALFLVSAVVVFGLLRIDRVVVAPGSFAGGTIAVRAPVGGLLAEILVAPGDRVASGQVLLRFDTAPLLAEVGLARARLAHLESRRRLLELEIEGLATGVHPAELEQMRRQVERSLLAMRDAETAHQRQQSLAAEGLAPDEVLQAAELARRLAELTLEESRSAVPLLQRRHTTTLVELQRDADWTAGELAAQRLALAELERRLALCEVAAPASGIVVGAALYELAQSWLAEGQEILRLECGAPVRFEGVLDDLGRAVAAPGQRVKIRVDGFPWLMYGTVPGQVAAVASHRDQGGAGFPVVVAIEPGAGPSPLADGMTGRARLIVGERVTLGKLLLEQVMGVDLP